MTLDKIFQRHASRGFAITDSVHQITYQALDEQSRAFAVFLSQRGVRPGERIALLMRNCLEMVVAYFAIFKIGGVAVPINTRFKSPELAYVLHDSEASFLLLTDEFLPLYHEIQTSFNRLMMLPAHVILGRQESHTALPAQSIQPDDLACILYTSGTTGRPKGVMHTHRSLLATAINQSTTLDLDASIKTLITLPICHIAGFAGQLLTTFYVGGQVFLLQQFEPDAVFQAISAYNISQVMMLPFQIETLMQHKNHSALSFVLQCIVGGDKIPLATHQKFHDITGHYITECCGMTESFSYAMNDPKRADKLGSIGKPVHDTVLKIIAQDGNTLPNKEIGEILVQSKANTTGYWNQSALTQQLLQANWLHTGDLALQDEDGYFWFQGRKKDIIIRGGSNISPVEVEAVLYQHPAIREVGVVGYPDASLGQLVYALVVLHESLSATESDLKHFVSRFLADYKVPAKIIFKTRLPHNALGKLDRKKLLESVKSN